MLKQLLLVVALTTLAIAQVPDTEVQAIFYTDEGLVSKQNEYYQVIFFPCVNGTYEISVNIHEQNAAGISLFAYASTAPNPTKCNYNRGWTTEEYGSAIPRESMAVNGTIGKPLYISVTTGFTTQSATFSVSMRWVPLTRIRPAPLTHYNPADCQGSTFTNVPILQAFLQFVDDVDFEEYKVYHIPICVAKGPNRTTKTTINTDIEGVIGTSAFETVLSKSHNFFPQSPDVVGTDISKQYISQIQYTANSDTFPQDMYLRVEGWGGYFVSKKNFFRMSVRLSWS